MRLHYLERGSGEPVLMLHGWPTSSYLWRNVMGPVAEGNVGSGTGMICHGFKGGIGTSSRVVEAVGGATVGVLVQANHGRRERLRINGVAVGEAIPASEVPEPGVNGAGSIIAIVATDAPLLPVQCSRLAQRAGLGIARVGGVGENSSGDIFLAFTTGNRGLPPSEGDASGPLTVPVEMLSRPKAAVRSFAFARAIRSSMPQLLPRADRLSYSGPP